MASNLDDDSHHTTVSSAAETTSFPPQFVNEPKGYALSGKIMLSAIIILFAVVVIMICFHIYARWYILRTRRRNVLRARRRTHLVFYIDPNDASNAAPIPTRGLDALVIKSLPTFVHNNTNTDMKNVEVLECAVCLSEFENDELGRMLPKCSHSFHVECIDMWFQSHDTCPLCRAPVESADLPAEKVEESGSHVVELTELDELTLSQLSESVELEPSQVRLGCPSTSFSGRKGMDLVVIEVPRRCQSFSFTNSDESGPSRSPGQGCTPTSRVRSLKRFLSGNKKPSMNSPSGSGPEYDLEFGGVDPPTPTSQIQSQSSVMNYIWCRY